MHERMTSEAIRMFENNENLENEQVIEKHLVRLLILCLIEIKTR